jgi:uncharacterized membrane protein YjjP (DUF1212 family)
MKIEGYLFAFIFAFLVLTGSVYLILSGDPSGGVPLFFAAGLGLIIGYYLLYTARRMEPRPEDRPDAEIEEGSGEIGFFSPHSWWPLWLGLGSALMFLGVIFGLWLVLIGGGATFVAVTGLLLEYYVKEEA